MPISSGIEKAIRIFIGLPVVISLVMKVSPLYADHSEILYTDVYYH